MTIDCTTISCTAGSTLTFVIAGMINRFYNEPFSSGSFILSATDASLNVIDYKSIAYSSSGLSLTLEICETITFSNWASSSLVVNAATSITVTMTTSIRLLKSSYLYISIPTDTFPKDGSITCSQTATSTAIACTDVTSYAISEI